MAKFRSLTDSISETGNWNVADSYSKFKIMRLLGLTDEYEEMATFGTSSLYEDLVIQDDNLKDLARIKAVKRLFKALVMLVNNTAFAVKKTDKQKLLDLKALLEDKIKPKLSLIERVQRNERTGTRNIKVNEIPFNQILDLLIEIKADMLEPMNNADLIFGAGEEDIDPRKLKEDIIERLITQG